MQDTMMDLLYEAAEPSFSDPEDFVDDIGDEELLGDLLQERPLEAEGIACSCVVVDNVPRVGPEKLDRLKKALHKIFSKYGDVAADFYPEGDDGANKGYVFMEYATPAQAAEAAKAADGHKLDKQHTLRVTTLSDFDRVMNVGDDWEPPEEQPFKDTGNLQHWLLDPDCCDQYSVIYEAGQRTAIFSNDAAAEPVPVEERKLWTETYVRWSPQGTYLATFHQRGIALWGGEKFKQIQRFNHPGVSLADFSPCESYVVTCSPPAADAKEDPQALVIIWDVKSGQTKRVFHCESSTHWPIFKWSHDGKYLARMTQDTLSIYETPSMFLLDKKSLTIVGIKDFSWSPGDNIVAFWSHGGHDLHDLTAKVTLMQIPSRQDIKCCPSFDVVDCKLHWQRNGHYLCVRVGRHPKGARGVVTSFKIFRMREKVVPVDVLEMKDGIVTFALEPNGSRLAVIHGESPSRYSVSVYHIQEGGSVKLIKVLENQPVNSIFWSPRGQFLVLAGLETLNGQLVFLDASDCTVMNTAEHYTASDVEWDPTGRYVVTSVSWWSHKVDNAFWLWSFQGRLLRKVGDKERFCQLLWRPRPPALLGAEQTEAIRKNLKSFSKVFEQKDRLSQSRASKELVDRRRAMVEGYEQYRQDATRAYRQQRELRLRLREGVDTDELDSGVGGGGDWEEETVEFFIGEERIPL